MLSSLKRKVPNLGERGERNKKEERNENKELLNLKFEGVKICYC